ncbi:MAG: glycosyltransferase family 39 protein [Anaerolineae bacterium]|nr:glycosyltransferase family 39 protein [Anaerolineae bacterium]
MMSNLFHQKLLWPTLLLVATDALILGHAPLFLSYPAAILLLMFLPGWVWGQFFFADRRNIPERITLAVALSISLTVFGSLFTVYLPGTMSLHQLLIVINGVIIVGLGVDGWVHRATTPPASVLNFLLPSTLIFVLLLAAALRLPRLGYAEFHEDEAEALMLGVRLLQGEDYAIFLHRKGPAQMLLPVAGWLLSDRITETLARLPFALSSLFSVAALFILGRYWFNKQVGLIAALLWAINGYAIAFGRMVQYQALIFFMGPLALYCLYQAWQTGRWRWQIAGAILLAACLMAHFDALLLLPAAAYLGWLYLTRSDQTETVGGASHLPSISPPFKRRLIQSTMTLILFLSLLAAFYIPYTLDPDFSNTTTYLTESRIKPGLLYNNLDLLRRFDRDYSSHFYLLLLGIGLLRLMWELTDWRIGSRLASQDKPRYFPASLLSPRLVRPLLVLAIITYWTPEIWRVGSLSLAIVPWLLLLAICFGLAPTREAKAAWLMFGAPLLGYVFLVDDPRTHLYILYPGAVLLAGAGWGGLIFRSHIRKVFVGIGIALVAVVIPYVALVFLQSESTFTTLRRQWDDSAWEWLYDDLPQPREYFGYPKREGWKAIGALRAEGAFPGDFRSVNEDFIIPIWYNYGEARSCYDTPAHVFVRTTGIEPFGSDTPYQPIAEITRENERRLQIFGTEDSPTTLPIYPLEDYAAQFDRLASPQQFTQQATPTRPVGAQFGPAITLTGFDLPDTTLAPGDTLYINLYWQALQPPHDHYRAFVHLTDGTTLWSQQDDDPACRLPTTVWRAGQHGLGQFRLPIPLDMPPGRYPLIIGLYQVDTLERLTLTGGAGQPGDDFLWLGDIEITPMNRE